MHEIAEHNHYVQGVAWDPLNEYFATQSSDRSMHIYNISHKNGSLEVHAVGKNARMGHRHSRTPSVHSRQRNFRRESTASETESVITSVSERLNDEVAASSTSKEQQQPPAMLTPTASVASTPSMTMFPPPYERTSSRRSSFSGSNAPSSPANYSRYGRSPSPMPALPAIRMAPTTAWSSVKLYGDESFTNFFRRLTFSPDGGLLLTPAGQFEDPSVVPAAGPSKSSEGQTRGRKGHPSNNDPKDGSSSVYIYSRANFARPPIARLPGHKKASVAVRFSPILYELRPHVWGSEPQGEPKTVTLEPDTEVTVDIDVGVPPSSVQDRTPHPSPAKPSAASAGGIAAPSPRIAIPTGPTAAMMPSPALSATDSLRPPTPAASKPGTPAPPMTPTATASIFALPYRMLYAVATMDTVMIYDTQQAGPVCLLTKLHYDEFTDMSW